MKLYYSPASPFVRKVVVHLRETGQLDQVELVSAGGTPVDPGTMPVRENPLGKIPALVLDDGSTLFDSRVICRFLDERAGGKLYPTGDALWPVLALEAMADGMADAAVLMTYETRVRPEAMRMQEWVEGQWQKIVRSLDALEGGWHDRLGGDLNMGHVAVAVVLDYIDFRHGVRDWRNGRPKLAAWHKVVSQRPAMQATVPVA